MKDQQQNVGQTILGYYRKNKKQLLKEAIAKDNVQLSNKLIELYKGLGENLDDIFVDKKEEEMKTKTSEEVSLSEIFARKLR